MANTSENPQSESTLEAPTAQRDRVRTRLVRLKKTALVGSLVGFVGMWALVANHSVGVTASNKPATVSHNSDAPSATPTSDSNSFFGSGNGSSSPVSPGGANGSGPSLGSGAS
jgi:hypothetical protein